jgi:hypothetical protein
MIEMVGETFLKRALKARKINGRKKIDETY